MLARFVRAAEGDDLGGFAGRYRQPRPRRNIQMHGVVIGVDIVGADLRLNLSIHRREIGRQYARQRSEEHTSELQSLMRISYAVFCLKKKKKKQNKQHQVNKTK